MNCNLTSARINLLLTFLAGATLGGVVAALTTPKRGADLRKDLARLGGRAKDQVSEWAETATEAMAEATTPGKGRAVNAAEALQAEAETAAVKGRSAWREIKKGTTSAGNEIKEGIAAAAKELT